MTEKIKLIGSGAEKGTVKRTQDNVLHGGVGVCVDLLEQLCGSFSVHDLCIGYLNDLSNKYYASWNTFLVMACSVPEKVANYNRISGHDQTNSFFAPR